MDAPMLTTTPTSKSAVPIQSEMPLVSGEDGLRALEIVDAVYRSCRTGDKVTLGQ